MQVTRAEVLDWLEAALARPLSLTDQADVLGAAGCDGDDAFELIDAFAARFGVDMAGYRWEWHHCDEGRMLATSWPIPVRPRNGAILPLSVEVLTRAAQTKVWPLTYPSDPDLPASLAWLNLPVLLLGLPMLTFALIVVIPRVI